MAANNSAPANRRSRLANSRLPASLGARKDAQMAQDNADRVARRSRKLTICLLTLVGSITCLSPYLSLHLTQRVGLLLFESDIVQLRASLFSVIICFIFLVSLNLAFIYSSNSKCRDRKRTDPTWCIQKLLSRLISLFAIISSISYLSLALIVPQIRQIQRMPIATFDCNANLITIENCQQQFTSKAGELGVIDATRQLLSGDLNGNSERLIRKLNCLKYNDKDLELLEVPTRFLLHKCGLVCKPQRQQLRQFSDDLNHDVWLAERGDGSTGTPPITSTTTTTTSSPVQTYLRLNKLVPPYNRAESGQEASEDLNGDRHLVYRNSSSSLVDPPVSSENERHERQISSQMSVRVCFSGEISDGSNYKQFCITNLAGGAQKLEQAMTVGQLNAMLRARQLSEPADADQYHPGIPSPLSDLDRRPLETLEGQPDERDARGSQASDRVRDRDDHTTHYVNPVVQFESHFKNWPHLPHSTAVDSSSQPDDFSSLLGGDETSGWCKFRPIPPFIVNNKPFSDIQCSLEHEYTLTTRHPTLIDSTSFTNRGADKIYLKKSSVDSGGQLALRERCNIQCKVNILYQVHRRANLRQSSAGSTRTDLHLYLPLKPCVMMSGEGDKSKSANSYMLFRSLGDSTLTLSLILLDLFLLLESMHTKQFSFESKRLRLVGVLLMVSLLPVLVALAFDLIASSWLASNLSRSTVSRDGYLKSLMSERILPYLADLFTQSNSKQRSRLQNNLADERENNATTHGKLNHIHSTGPRSNRFSLTHMLGESFLAPFFLYAVLMFALALNSLAIPFVTPTTSPLVRVSSSEELGLARDLQSSRRAQAKVKRTSNDGPTEAAAATEQLHQPRPSPGRRWAKFIPFALLTLFMGTQFSLSQLTQTQILIESFGNPTMIAALADGHSYGAVKFTLLTHTSAAMFVFLVCLLFLEEISIFLGRFSPFSSSKNLQAAKRIDDNSNISTGSSAKESQASLLKYTSLSLLIYSIRHFALSSLNSALQFRSLVAFVFQLTELFNFPLTWFALAARAHQLVMEHSELPIACEEQTDSRPPASQLGVVHLAVQSGLAFVYFALARSAALYAHSLHVSIHLHSDDVDWFIGGFYRSLKLASGDTSSAAKGSPANQSGGEWASEAGDPMDSKGAAESLFSPLPGERQTYLHASRIFLRNNALVCVLLAAGLLANLVYIKYQLWSAQRRTLHILHGRPTSASLVRLTGGTTTRTAPTPTATTTTDDSLIDERLSLDLIQIHASSPRTSAANQTKQTLSAEDPQSSGARAKIHFRYNLAERHANSSDSSVSPQSAMTTPPPPPSFSDRREQQQQEQQPADLRIPINLVEEEEEEEVGPEAKRSKVEVDTNKGSNGIRRSNLVEPMEILERITRQRSRRVRIFEDGEDWPEVDETDRVAADESVKKPPEEKAEVVEPQQQPQGTRQAQNRPTGDRAKRSISFAPTTTLIGDRLATRVADNKPTGGDKYRNKNGYKQSALRAQQELQSRTSKLTSTSRASSESSVNSTAN